MWPAARTTRQQAALLVVCRAVTEAAAACVNFEPTRYLLLQFKKVLREALSCCLCVREYTNAATGSWSVVAQYVDGISSLNGASN
jgi:hypothetical protein